MQRPRRLEGDNVTLAVAAILLAVLSLSLGDALIKAISADFVLWQIFVVRSTIAVPPLLLAMRALGGFGRIRRRHLGWTLLRSMMLTCMWVFYYAALPHLTLSAAAATYYTLPIFITLFAAWFIGDRIGPAGWTAILTGFSGVLLILKPAAEDFNAYALLPLASANLYALAMIITRTKCRDDSPLALSLNLNMTFIATGLLATLLLMLTGLSGDHGPGSSFLLGPWTPMSRTEWITAAILAVTAIIGSVGGALAFQAGPSSLVASFDLMYVVFASVWGVLLFQEVPDFVTIVGITLVVGAGVLAVRRRPAPPGPLPP